MHLLLLLRERMMSGEKHFHLRVSMYFVKRVRKDLLRTHITVRNRKECIAAKAAGRSFFCPIPSMIPAQGGQVFLLLFMLRP